MGQNADVANVLAQEARQRRGRRRVLVWGSAGAALLLVAAGFWWWSGAGASTSAAYATDAVARGDIRATLTATGTLQPQQSVAVSSTVAGTIASVDVDYNQSVVRGQSLARLDLRDLDVRLSRSIAMVSVQEASVLAAEANLSDARAALARTTALAGSNGASQRDADLARTAVQRAEASLASAEAQLSAAQADLQAVRIDYARGTIVAPIDGVVLDVGVSPGQNIGTASLGQALFTVASDLRKLDLEVEIDEADVVRVAEGDSAGFTVEAWPDRPLDGTIRQIRSGPTISDGVVNYTAVIAVDNAALTLRPGMTATAEIAVDEALGALTVANAALRFSPDTKSNSGGVFAGMAGTSTVEQATTGARTIWVLEGGKARPVEVVAGLSDSQRTEIVSGDLKEGDLVITGSKAP